jgi:DNA invertase Pin-like site-specific DNA recombinase
MEPLTVLVQISSDFCTKSLVLAREPATISPEKCLERRMKIAFSYLRTSSATNADGDSPFRQDAAVSRFAASQGIEVRACFWDADVKGTDPIEIREGFKALLGAAEADGVRLVLVEDEGRFARSLIAQELGVLLLATKGIRVVTASGIDMTDSRDPAKVMMRQIAGAFAQYEKAKIVEKLKGARDRVKAATGKCEGRKSHGERNPAVVRQAKRLARRNPKTGQSRSLRAISAELAALGYLSASGKLYTASSVQNMLKQKVRE